MKNIVLTTFALLLAVAASAADSAAGPKPGIFDLKTVDASKAGLLRVEKIAVIETPDGFALATKTTESGWDLLGTMKSKGAYRLPAATRSGKDAVLTISRLKGDGGFDGVLNQDGELVNFTASLTSLGGLYRCGNHKTHLAANMMEMLERTKTSGCAQWGPEFAAVATPPDVAATARPSDAKATK